MLEKQHIEMQEKIKVLQEKIEAKDKDLEEFRSSSESSHGVNLRVILDYLC